MSNHTPSRRIFLKMTGGSVAAGATALASAPAHAAPTDTGKTLLPYPRKAVASAAKVSAAEPLTFSYPDAASLCYAIKLDVPVAAGVGPAKDIVAFSGQCTHMGCPVVYDAGTKVFKCGCHYSMFDAEKDGQMVCGQATENLPRITLEYDAKSGQIFATGVEGLIYGRQSNVL